MAVRILRSTASPRTASLALLLCGCSHEIFLGERSSQDALEAGAADAAPALPETGATDAPIGLDGASPVLLWSADHETGDLSQWHEGGDVSGGEYHLDGLLESSSWHAHRGKYAMRSLIDTSDRQDHLARAYRRTVPGGAFYGAWFFWEASHVPTEWWSIFLFRAQTDPRDPWTGVNLWDLYVVPAAGSNMTLAFFDHLTNRTTMSTPEISLSVGRWVHIEAFFEYMPPASTHVAFWLDDVPVLDLTGLGEAPTPNLDWAIGNGSNGLDPAASDLYIDDAAISTARLGPG
jgi:hypothetical protein